jgi:metal-responsive CopG/Arc/MetJ family transcriptional regulator
MPKKLTAKKGRPVTVGASIYVGTRFPPDLLQRIKRWSEAAGIGRSEALRQLIEAGLKSAKAKRGS